VILTDHKWFGKAIYKKIADAKLLQRRQCVRTTQEQIMSNPRAMRPVINVNEPGVMDTIRAALHTVQADIVIDDDGVLVAAYDGHYWRQDNNVRMCDCLARHLRFMRGGRDIDPPAALARSFFRLARELHWFKREHRGPCPGCAAKGQAA
jgi:hypothetical protein